MGGSVQSTTPLPYNVGTAPAVGTPGQSGGGGAPVAQGGGVYTPKFGQPVYMGQYLPQADVNFINEVPQVAGATSIMEQFINQYMPSLNSPAMSQPTNYSPAQTSAMGQLISQNALGMMPYENQALVQGFDPQNALYQRTAQQLQDQIRSSEAAAGVAATPYGSSIEDQQMANFNLDWINQQQQRESAAASTAAQLASTLGQEVAGGQQLAQAGPSFQTSILSSLLGNTTTALNPQQVALSDYLSYMGQNQQAELTASQQNIAGVSSLLDFIASTSSGGSGGGSGGGGKPGGGGGGGGGMEALAGKAGGGK